LEPSIFNLAFHFFMALVLIFPFYFICHTALRIVLSLGTSTLFIRKKKSIFDPVLLSALHWWTLADQVLSLLHACT
jgi:hypothetical protein